MDEDFLFLDADFDGQASQEKVYFQTKKTAQLNPQNLPIKSKAGDESLEKSQRD